jgi:hypothetical protein
MHIGHAKGKLSLEYSDMVDPETILRYHPELKSMLEEIIRAGWKYLYIVTRGRAIAEFDVQHKYRLTADGLGYNVKIAIGNQRPQITGVPEVEEFRINICSKSFPRAATMDLSKGIVTYLHDAFWGWQEEWKNDPDRFSQSKEVYEVARWLLDMKKMKLHENYKLQRFEELRELFEPPRREQAMNK